MNWDWDTLSRLGLFLGQANLFWSLGVMATFFLVRQLEPRVRYSVYLVAMAALPIGIGIALMLNLPSARTVTEPITIHLYEGTLLEAAMTPAGELENPTTAQSLTQFLARAGSGLALLLGAVLLAVFWFRLKKLIHWTGTTHQRTQSQLNEQAQALGIRRPIQLLVAGWELSPFSFGFGRPKVVVPVKLLETIQDPALKLILCHELHHIRRHDFLVNVVQKLVRIAFFYNPVVHWLDRRIDLDRECLCDAAVLATSSCSKREYAEVLLHVAQFVRRHPNLSPQVPLHSKTSHLEQRIRHMKNKNFQRPTLGRTTLTLATLVTSFAAVALTGYGASHRDTQDPPATKASNQVVLELGAEALTVTRNGVTHRYKKGTEAYSRLAEQYERLIKGVEHSDAPLTDSNIATPLNRSREIMEAELRLAEAHRKAARAEAEFKEQERRKYGEELQQYKRRSAELERRYKSRYADRPSERSTAATAFRDADRGDDEARALEKAAAETQALQEQLSSLRAHQADQIARIEERLAQTQNELAIKQAQLKKDISIQTEQLKKQWAEVERIHSETAKKQDQLRLKQELIKREQEALTRQAEVQVKKQQQVQSRLRSFYIDRGLIDPRSDRFNVKITDDRLVINGKEQDQEILDLTKEFLRRQSDESRLEDARKDRGR